MNDIDINALISILQKKVTDLTLTNIVLEAKINDLTKRLNSSIENSKQENAVDGNENSAQEVNDT
ncbi:MAG: hypothetical protein CM15mV5_2800 [uncultured marine virus]|nr:MAG: hypothetical protein CM15mV5_2800 [uncultured marine virus]